MRALCTAVQRAVGVRRVVRCSRCTVRGVHSAAVPGEGSAAAIPVEEAGSSSNADDSIKNSRSNSSSSSSSPPDTLHDEPTQRSHDDLSAPRTESGEEPPEKFPLTIDPETAHAKQVAQYAEYKEYMTSLQSGDRMQRRRALIAQMSDAELVRRTKEYGAFGELMAIDPDNRWVGVYKDTKIPARFRTLRSRTVRTVYHLTAYFCGFGFAWMLTWSESCERVGRDIITYCGSQVRRGMLYGHGYDGGSLAETFCGLNIAPKGLVDGEEPDTGPWLFPFRFSTLQAEFAEGRDSSRRRERHLQELADQSKNVVH